MGGRRREGGGGGAVQRSAAEACHIEAQQHLPPADIHMAAGGTVAAQPSSAVQHMLLFRGEVIWMLPVCSQRATMLATFSADGPAPALPSPCGVHVQPAPRAPLRLPHIAKEASSPWEQIPESPKLATSSELLFPSSRMRAKWDRLGSTGKVTQDNAHTCNGNTHGARRAPTPCTSTLTLWRASRPGTPLAPPRPPPPQTS